MVFGAGCGGGNSPCIHERLGEVLCHNGYGWFNPTNACYYNQLTLAPDDPGWKGDPADGDMYLRTCYNGASGAWLVDDTVYLQSPPPGYGGIPSVLVLWNRAIAQLPLDLPAVETRPRALGTGAVGLVGLPVWLWVNNRNWG